MPGDKIDQISLYRRQQKFKKYLYDKYKDLIEFDSTKRSASRIVNAVSKHILHSPINDSILPSVPGLFRIRLPVTELNMLPLEIQKDIPKHISNAYPIRYWIALDLRIYGPCPEMGIYITDIDQMFYLSREQIDKISRVWAKINPESTAGIRFQQMVDSSRTLAAIYKLNI
jgi:hypothetical protein